MQDCIINASLKNKMQYVFSENRERALYKELESSDWHQDMHCLATFCDLHEVSRLYGTKAHTGIHPYYSLKRVFICVVVGFQSLYLILFLTFILPFWSCAGWYAILIEYIYTICFQQILQIWAVSEDA